MSEPAEQQPSEQAPEETEGEELDALPVLAAPVPLHLARAPAPGELRPAVLAMPAVQAAAVAAGGFVAGAAMVGLVHRRRSRAIARRRRFGLPPRGERSARRSAAGELVQIVGSRSLLVDVHLLGGPGRGS